MFRHLLNVIEKVVEGRVRDRYGNDFRYVGFLVTEDEFEKYREEACKLLAEYVNNELNMENVPEEERKKVVEQVASCLLDPHEALRRYGVELDYYLAEIKDVEAQYLLSDLLEKVKGAPTDAQATEEVAYGLPEFSLYWGADARSYTGRWSYPDAYTDIDVCWGLIDNEQACKHVIEAQRKLDILADIKREKTKKPYKWIFAVWRED